MHGSRHLEYLSTTSPGPPPSPYHHHHQRQHQHHHNHPSPSHIHVVSETQSLWQTTCKACKHNSDGSPQDGNNFQRRIASISTVIIATAEYKHTLHWFRGEQRSPHLCFLVLQPRSFGLIRKLGILGSGFRFKGLGLLGLRLFPEGFTVRGFRGFIARAWHEEPRDDGSSSDTSQSKASSSPQRGCPLGFKRGRLCSSTLQGGRCRIWTISSREPFEVPAWKDNST